MKVNKNHIMITLAVLSISILAMFDFYTLPNVYALTVRSASLFVAAPSKSSYISSIDDIVWATSGTAYKQADAGNLTTVGSGSAGGLTAFTNIANYANSNSDALLCSTSVSTPVCVQVGQSDTGCTDCFTATIWNYNTHAASTFVDTSCLLTLSSTTGLTGAFVSGNSIYIGLAPSGGSCDGTSTNTFAGIYTISFTNIIAGNCTSCISLYYADSTFVGSPSTSDFWCYVSPNIYSADGTNLYKKNFQTGQLNSIALGHSATNIACGSTVGNNLAVVYTSSITNDNIKRISVSSFTVTHTLSLTNPYALLVRGDTVFATRDSTIIQAYDRATPSSNFQFYNGLDATNQVLQIGNSTRFNVVSTSNVWAFDGVEGEPSEEPTAEEEFCEIPANVNLLTCRLQNEGTLTGSSVLLNQSGTNIMCMIGLIQCTQGDDGNFTPDNPDIQTNGTGYILAVVALGIMIGIFWVASRGQLMEIPTFLWFIGVLGILGALTAFGWINPTFLIIGVVAVIGFAVAKARNVFGGQTLFNEG